MWRFAPWRSRRGGTGCDSRTSLRTGVRRWPSQEARPGSCWAGSGGCCALHAAVSPRAMRVLLITDTLRPDYGWGRYSIGLIRALREEGLSYSLLSPRELCTEPDLGALPNHGRVTSFVSQTRRLSKLTFMNALRIGGAL